MTREKRTTASIFSGAGGFDWGFHRAGFETQLAVELKEHPAKTLAHNLSLKTLYPSASPTVDDLPFVVQGDIREVDFSRFSSLNPDVLIGGPPCQDFSVSKGSKREGLNGGRGKLYLEFLRALMFLQPRMFVFENVPGFISANEGLAYQTVLDDLQNLESHRKESLIDSQLVNVPDSTVHDYIILFNSVVDASRIGVPQTRRRLIIIGIRKDLAASSKKFEKSITSVLTGSLWSFARYPLTTMEIFEGQPLYKLQDKYQHIMNAYQSLGEAQVFEKALTWRNHVWDNLTFDIVKDYHATNGLNYDAHYKSDDFDRAMREHEEILSELGWLGNPVYELTDSTNDISKQRETVKTRMFHIPPGENAGFVNNTQWQVESKEISFIYRRILPLKPASTVMAYGGGGTHGYHYDRNRQMLTLRERARIQTFSDHFEFMGSDIRAQIGEAVPPLLAERIAYEVRDILDQVDE